MPNLLIELHETDHGTKDARTALRVRPGHADSRSFLRDPVGYFNPPTDTDLAETVVGQSVAKLLPDGKPVSETLRKALLAVVLRIDKPELVPHRQLALNVPATAAALDECLVVVADTTDRVARTRTVYLELRLN
ncbi:hypothetical protein [Niveibacterium sp.]|uniref:hypothetical protein n=1 Tax=Niveibacterium sp. TaxID=2017444 RepID=UPI0035B30C67